MKKILLASSIFATMVLTGCTYTETESTYGPGYSNRYVTTTTAISYDTNPNYIYTGYYSDTWYGGTPDYYTNSVYVSDW